ncbi:hypothetical protein CNECB9_1910004 [Cupriavidus necator]|uniref:Uncharacterized protein n=1 Tax=Cupriavidus necator TaxID=106590 RepID=A0A1K0IBQ8_CUPNE|nr:hypothetical protein CNECB9_1910004 [Cupriavidus necator]
MMLQPFSKLTKYMLLTQGALAAIWQPETGPTVKLLEKQAGMCLKYL